MQSVNVKRKQKRNAKEVKARRSGAAVTSQSSVSNCGFLQCLVFIVALFLCSVFILGFALIPSGSNISQRGPSEKAGEIPDVHLNIKQTAAPSYQPPATNEAVSVETPTKDYKGKPSNIKHVKGEKNPKKNGPPKKKKEKQPSQWDQMPELDNGVEVHIEKMPTPGKWGIKVNMRVLLPEIDFNMLETNHEDPSQIVGEPRDYTAANQILDTHPLFAMVDGGDVGKTSLEDTMYYLHNRPECSGKPVFLSMASVGDDLYWQLIENFVYTMVKFRVSQCALVICVSDANCMRLCRAAKFPCYDFRSAVRPLPSVMEQIGEVKLFHVPKALEKGVDVFMLDLDVGFLFDPMVMVKAFVATPNVDVFVQEDLIFLMNRTTAGWRTWFTEPLPNIGLFLCRGNNKTAKVFNIAWEKYQKMEDAQSKKDPGKDQNHVLDGMRIGRGTFRLRYAYFSNDTAVLLDKMTIFNNRSVELGGQAAAALLTPAKTMAAHMTCYEHTTKVLGLKATNSYWNPRYYDALRPTLTKPILYISEDQVLQEMRALMWLGLATGRAVIIPNLLGHEQWSNGGRYHGQAMWPGFRVTRMERENGHTRIKVDVLEPAFYWRVQRDYDDVPEPRVILFNPFDDTLQLVRDLILAEGDASPRIVLHGVVPNAAEEDREKANERAKTWAQDSVGIFELPYSQERLRYLQLPTMKQLGRDTEHVSDVLDGMRNCKDIFGPPKGNRSCFQICE